MTFEQILAILWEGAHDSLKLLPFLFLTYLSMELIEHKAGDGVKNAISRAGKLGPLLGAALGLIPQCGFSAVAAGLYAARIVTPGTVLAVFLATSDEMIPVMLGAGIPVPRILLILLVKFVVATTVGFAADLLFRRFTQPPHVESFCDDEHCHCERGVWRSALHHTLQVFLFVLVINLGLGFLLEFVDAQAIGEVMYGVPVLGEAVAALVGLVPNCAASVAITTLYTKGLVSAGALIAGLLTGAGAGLLVLFRTNRRPAENFTFMGVLFLVGVFFGCLLGWTGLLGAMGL